MSLAAQPTSLKIGVVMPIAEEDATHPAPSYSEIRAFAHAAEESPLDSIWVYDHLLFRFGEKPTAGIWEAWSLLAALAADTRRVELGTIVMCTAFRNPAVLAKMAVTVDEISGGRLTLGLGAGWHQPEFDAFGIPFDHKVDRFEEALQIITPLLRQGHVDFTGQYYSAPNCELTPRGPRPAGPPVLIGSFKPRMLRLTARYADSWNTCWLGDPTALDEPLAKVQAACREEGRDPATLAITVGVSLAAPGTSGESAPDPRKVIAGSPDDVAAAFRGYAERGVSHLICALAETDLASLEWLSAGVERFRAG